MSKNFIVLITGASGGGKTTIINKLLELYPEKYHRVSTYTTRNPRSNEKNGEQYNFISEEEYWNLYREDKLIACSNVEGQHYGAPKLEGILKKCRDRNIIMDIGAKGARELKQIYRNVVSIYIIPPNQDILIKQMGDRASSRLDRSKKQLEIIKQISHWLIINDTVEDSAKQIDKIISILSIYVKKAKDVEEDDIRFLYERNLYNKKNTEFLDNFYTRKKEKEEEYSI